MKNQKRPLWVLGMLCLFGNPLSAQQGQFVHGANGAEHINTATFVPWTGNTVLAGSFSSNSTSQGLLLEEKTSPTGFQGFKHRYFVAGSGYQITAIIADPNTQTFITAGTSTQTSGQVNTFFHRLDANGNVLGTWEMSAKDKLSITSISLASDGRYLIGGRSETTTPQQSFAFAAKIQLVPFASVSWQHQFTSPALAQGATDHTVAVVERSDGTYLVGGNTHPSSNPTAVAPFLAHLDFNGNLLSYQHYFKPGFTFATAKDMVITSTDEVYFTGTATIPVLGNDIFLLRINSSLSAITFASYSPAAGTTLDESATSLVVNEAIGQITIAGFASVPAPHFNGLLLNTDLATNLLAVKSYGGSGNDAFSDLILLPNGNLHAVGNTFSFSPTGSLGENMYSVRLSALLNSGCNQVQHTFFRSGSEFITTAQHPVDQPDLSLGAVSSRRLLVSLTTQTLCSGPQPRLSPAASSVEAGLFPNPVRSDQAVTITSPIPAQIIVSDIHGRILQQFTTDQHYATLTVAGYPNGLYWVRVIPTHPTETDAQPITHRLVIE